MTISPERPQAAIRAELEKRAHWFKVDYAEPLQGPYVLIADVLALLPVERETPKPEPIVAIREAAQAYLDYLNDIRKWKRRISAIKGPKRHACL